MALSKLAIRVREDNIKNELGNVKNELEEIVTYIQNIEDGKGNLTEGKGLIYKAQNVAKLISHKNRKNADMINNLTELAFEIGKVWGESEQKQKGDLK